MDTKTCTKCGETKPVDEFYRNRASRDGYCRVCKACGDVHTRQWMNANRSRWSAYMREYRQAGKQKGAAA